LKLVNSFLGLALLVRLMLIDKVEVGDPCRDAANIDIERRRIKSSSIESMN
jgi:hypothetical protein